MKIIPLGRPQSPVPRGAPLAPNAPPAAPGARRAIPDN